MMSLRKQTLLNSLGSLVLLGCQWLISILLVRVSGYEDAGVFALAMSIANVFSTLVNYGMRNYQVTDIDNAFLPNQYLFARLCLSGLSVLFCLLYLRLDGYTARNAAAILLYLSYQLSFQLSDIIMGNLQRAGRLEINGYSNSLRGGACFLLFMLTQLTAGRLLLSLGAMSLGSLAVLLLYDVPRYRRLCPERGGLSREGLRPARRLYTICFFVFVSTIIPIVITAVPRRDIQRQMGETMLGVFSAVYTPMVILNTLIPSLLLGLIPRVTGLWRTRQMTALRKELAKCYGLVAGITAAALLFSAAGGRLFLSLVYGPDILPYASLLCLAVAAIGLNCACVCGGFLLVAFERRWQTALFSGVSLMITLLLSGSFVGRLGIYGAADILILAYAVQALLQLGLILLILWKERKR